MTRFARAKGSKASNERKPEEATSWSEMRRSMLWKKPKEPEEKTPEKAQREERAQQKTEWASLGDGDPLPSKQKLRKKNEKGSEEILVKKKNKKKMEKSKSAEVVTSSLDGEETKKKKKKKEKMKICEEKEVKVKKKREKIKEESEDATPKKKKKREETEGGEEGGSQNNKSERKEGVGERFRRRKGKEGKTDWGWGGRGEYRGWTRSQMGGKGRFWGRNPEEVGSSVEEIIINGEKIKIVKFQGFYVTVEDAERLKKLRKEMQKAGIPREKLESAVKLERRRAEKALSRLKKSVCFHCRGGGHLLSDCPELKEKETTGTGICYKCGSGEHSANECKVERGSRFQFAECFICKEQGHIARQCPDNPRGLYPKGGGCRECGDVTHLRKDCPSVLEQKEEETVTVGVRDERSLEGLEEEEKEAAERKRKRGEEETTRKKKKQRVKF